MKRSTLCLVLLALSSSTVSASGHDATAPCKLPDPPATEMVVCSDPIEDSLAKLGGGTFFGQVIIPENTTQYTEAVKQYGSVTYFDRSKPSFVAVIQTESDVQAAVRYAKQCTYGVAIRSGGHSYLAVSSCNSDDSPCMQIDVGEMKKLDVDTTTNQIIAGPGNRLDNLADKLHEHGLFMPTGECAKVGVGGHMQTGGFGLWTRHFGTFLESVSGFRIVLADGSVQDVQTPSDSTSRLNDDLFYAVLGGASGSWGVVTEITLNAVKDDAYFSAFWQVQLVWNADGAENMFRKWAQVAAAHEQDARWSTHWTVVGAQPAMGVNYIELEASWVAPLAQAGDYDPSFFQDILDACTNCAVLKRVNVTEAMSASLANRYLCCRDGPEFPAPFRYYEKSFQQASQFPDGDKTAAIVSKIDTFLPNENSTFLFVFQLTTAFKPRDGATRALPFPGDKIGIVCDFFFPDPRMAPIFKEWKADFTAVAVENLGEDHQTFWGAYDDPDLATMWAQFYESEDKYETLKDIKACVDPENLFTHLMSMPVGEVAEREFKDAPSAASARAISAWTSVAPFLLWFGSLQLRR